MPPADYIKTVGLRIPAQTREQILTQDLLVWQAGRSVNATASDLLWKSKK